MIAGTRILSRFSCQSSLPGSRSFWSWLNYVCNKVDNSRIDEVGPDRAAAEWLIRCGASVRWAGQHHYDSNYDNLVRVRRQDRIEAIDGTDSSISHTGFPYLSGLTCVKEFVIQRNSYLEDEALQMMKPLRASLVSLRIVSCVNVTDAGIKSLSNLTHLQQLYLADLMSVKNPAECIQFLRSALPLCDITSKLRTN